MDRAMGPVGFFSDRDSRRIEIVAQGIQSAMSGGLAPPPRPFLSVISTRAAALGVSRPNTGGGGDIRARARTIVSTAP